MLVGWTISPPPPNAGFPSVAAESANGYPSNHIPYVVHTGALDWYQGTQQTWGNCQVQGGWEEKWKGVVLEPKCQAPHTLPTLPPKHDCMFHTQQVVPSNMLVGWTISPPPPNAGFPSVAAESANGYPSNHIPYVVHTGALDWYQGTQQTCI